MKELIIASTNMHKVEEIRTKLADSKWLVRGIAEYPDIPAVEEDCLTFKGNAQKKARIISETLGKVVLSDDSGLCVDALNGRPGVFSNRYAGENASDSDKINKLLTELKNIADEKRTAHFTCAMVLWGPQGEIASVEGQCEGSIAAVPSGSNGFGYDPIFYIPEKGCTMAALSLEEKNSISHRARALAGMLPILSTSLIFNDINQTNNS